MHYSLVLVLTTAFSISTSHSIQYYVSPTPLPNPHCPQKSICHMLNEYAYDNTTFFSGQSNISMLFLSGVHHLNLSLHIVSNGSLYLTSEGQIRTAEIVIPRRIEIIVIGLEHLHIENIKITGHDLPTLFFTIILVGIGEIDLNTSILRQSSINIIYPIQSKSTNGNNHTKAAFTLCDFIWSSVYVHYNSSVRYHKIQFSANENGTVTTAQSYNTVFKKCQFDGGLISLRVNSVYLLVNVCECYMYNNDDIIATVDISNGLVGHHQDDTSHVQLFIENTTIANSSSVAIALMEISNITVHIVNSLLENISQRCVLVMRIYTIIYFEVRESVFAECQLGAVVIDDADAFMIVRNSAFLQNSNNNPENGVGISIACHDQIYKDSGLQIEHVQFIRNHGHADYGRVVDVSYCNAVNISHAVFDQNVGTSLKLSSTDLHVHGNVTFTNNTAYQGGAMSLLYSRLNLYNNSNIVFADNTVKNVGGALYVEHHDPFIPVFNTLCFYIFPEATTAVDNIHVTLQFINNTASNGGLSIYGASVTDNCCITTVQWQVYSRYSYQSFFQFGNNSNLTDQLQSTVTSNPTRVCLCSELNIPVCNIISYIFYLGGSVYPGESITISAVIVGKDYGAAAGTIFAKALGEDDSIDSNQRTQTVTYSQCNALTYTVFSKPFANFSLVLTASLATADVYGDKQYVLNILAFQNPYAVFPGNLEKVIMSLPVFVNFTVDDCPVGFNLSDGPPHKCECNNRLLNKGITHCIISNHTALVYRSGDVWLSALLDPNKGRGNLIINMYCPTGYCKINNISIDLFNPDKQCDQYRSGMLCGGCKDNYSLSFGSTHCLQCEDNRFAALILPFAFGICVLVVAIKVLDLTVKHGTLNGIILYANIVWTHRNIFFDNYDVVQTAIAWLNLELGIDTCFINDLDAFGKTVIHFVQDFVNVIGIAALIILSTRYSQLATRIFGTNIVQVLATLFFFSYAKLLQTIVSTLSFHLLEYPDGIRVVWSMDGNLPYFGAKHLGLLVTAISAMMILWLPYTIVLMFFQCLQKKSHLRLLHWTDSLRLKPYLDSYYGPLKDNHRYWFGVLLFARVILVFTNTLSLLFNPYINLVAIMFVATSLLCHPSSYKSQALNIFENTVLLNLAVLSSCVLLSNVVGIEKAPFVYISVCIVLIQLLGVVVYHLYCRIAAKCCGNIKDNYNRRFDYEQLNDHTNVAEHEPLLRSVDTY